MSTPQPVNASHSLHKEIEAARVLLATYRDVLGEDQQAKADMVEGQTELREAIARGLSRILEIEILEIGTKAKQDELAARQARYAAQKQHLRTALCLAMEIAGLPKLETPIGTISLKQVPPRLEVVDEAAIPSRFFKPQEPRLDKLALGAALKAGEIVPGARLDNGSLSIAVTKG